MDSTESPHAASGSESLQQTIQILSPGTRIKSETVEEPVNGNNQTNRNLGARSRGKRKRQSSVKNSDPPRNSAKKVKENDDTRAHLHPIQDYLLHGLDVAFCGINPGRMSAETGHHFANPTNHFWRCLHRSGMTATLVSPFEDFSLPDMFNIGLTNLVDRPSSEACELSRAEMMASVPAFLNKLARYRPRFVCFVGVVIWKIVWNRLVKLLQPGTAKSMGKVQRKEKNQMGLQSYKLVWENVKGLPQETLIFVVPSTSGRVVQYQLPDKITLFTELCRLVKVPGSEIDTSGMWQVVMYDMIASVSSEWDTCILDAAEPGSPVAVLPSCLPQHFQGQSMRTIRVSLPLVFISASPL